MEKRARRRHAAVLAGILLIMGALAVRGIPEPGAEAAGQDADGQVSSREFAGQAERGEKIFRDKCAACHSLGDGRQSIGPDLAGVTERRDPVWLKRFILEPDRLFAEKEPLAAELLAKYSMPMPNLQLTAAEVEDVFLYLQHPGEAQHHPEPKAAAVPAGDPRLGESLFAGTLSFAKGGAPCLACHAIAGAGLGTAAGASYGPDLSALYEDYGDEGVASILGSLPFPSMEAIYAKRPLTPEEQVNLTAFLQEVSGRAAPSIAGSLLIQVVAGIGIAFLVLYLFGRRRLPPVRRSLVDQNK